MFLKLNQEKTLSQGETFAIFATFLSQNISNQQIMKILPTKLQKNLYNRLFDTPWGVLTYKTAKFEQTKTVYLKKISCILKNHSSIIIIFATAPFYLSNTANISLMPTTVVTTVSQQNWITSQTPFL